MSSLRVKLSIITLLVVAAILGIAKYQHRSIETSSLDHENDHRRLISESERPKMHTYFEQSEIYKPDDDSMDLLENWRKSWYDMGWNPIILTPQQAAQLPEYEQLMKLIPTDELFNREAIPSYKRWMAMVHAGGGWMCDYTVFPLNYFLQHGRNLPYDGALTTYMGASPVLMSGTAEEYRRLIRPIGTTAKKVIEHQKFLNDNYPESYKKNVLWNDGVALQELRKSISKDMFKIRGDVADKGAILQRDDSINCDISSGKRAIFFRGLAGNVVENRGTQARKFLNKWRAACGVGQATELALSKG